MKSLLIAKFVPGFSTVAPPLAGVTSHGSLEFLLYDGLGAFLWAGSAIALGRAFHRTIAHILAALENLGWWAVVIAVSALVLVVLLKWWQRMRFLRSLRVSRIEAAELFEMIEGGAAPVVLDVRTGSARKHDPRRIPRALVVTDAELESQLRSVPFDHDIILYCT